jgi:iron(III) transport system substrate-binding protein
MFVAFSVAVLVILAGSLVACAPSAAAPAPAGPRPITIYSGRGESLIGPLIQRFKTETGIDAQVRYGDTAELAAAILEEGRNSPADVFLAQDAGALGAIAQRTMFTPLPSSILDQVEPRFRSPKGEWVGVSGRARVVVYNQSLREQDLPDSILGFTDPRWRGRIGWAPTNGSFQAFVTALRITEGEAAARQWLEGIKANNPKAYANNTAIVNAVASGEIDVGLTNHYYLHAVQKDQGQIPVRNYHPRDGRAGAMVNVAGVGILATAKSQDGAKRFVEYLLSPGSQEYFTTETFEYPLAARASRLSGAAPLDQIRTPNIDLGSLADLDGTLRLLRETGVL